MNKAQLLEKISQKTQLPKTHSETVVDAMLEIIQKAVSKGEDVKLVGFGTFSQLKRRARTGRNPKTGETINVPGSKVPRFKPGKEFRHLLNKKH